MRLARGPTLSAEPLPAPPVRSGGSAPGNPEPASGRTGAIRFLLRYLQHYVPWGLLAFLSIAVFALTSGATIYLIDPIFNEVLKSSDGLPGPLPLAAGQPAGSEPSTMAELPSKLNLRGFFDSGYQGLKRRFQIDSDTVVYFVPLLVLAVFWLRSVADFISGYSFQRIGLGVTTDIRNDIFGRIVHQSSRFHGAHPTGELASRVVGDVTIMQVAVSTRVLDLFQQSATLLVLLVLLLSTNLRLALISLIAAPVVLYPIVRFGRGMRHTSRRSQERMADLSQLLIEAARGHRVVRAFGMEEFEVRRFSEATRKHLRVKLRSELFANVSGPVVSALAALGGAVFLVFAGGAIRAQELSSGLVVQFLANLLLMYDPIRKLNKVHLLLQEAMAAVHRVMDLMAIPLDVQERPGAITVTTFRSKLAFENVTFHYGEQPVLRGLSLEVRCGEMVALVGPSGAGKSTVANLLLRFFDPTSGRVTIDGHDLRDLTLKSLSSLISIVTQETVLFNDTIRNNIAYGRADMSLDLVRQAAAGAFADDFIRKFPDGYETRIGEGGARLSGGERQRLAIARALLKGAPILILDEATSQLDSESEALIKKALFNLMQDRTTLVIAHRLATVTSADRIVVMESGQIVELGTHRDLLERGGSYKKFFDLQFKI